MYVHTVVLGALSEGKGGPSPPSVIGVRQLITKVAICETQLWVSASEEFMGVFWLRPLGEI